MNIRMLWTILLVFTLGLSGCLLPAKTLAPVGGLSQETVDLTVIPEIQADLSTQAVVTRNSSASVDHVDIYLLRQVGDQYRPIHLRTRAVLDSLDDSNAYKMTVNKSEGFYNRKVTVRGLLRNTNYKLLGRAYNADNVLASKDDASCEALVSVSNDDRPVLPVRLSIALTNTPFVGQTQILLAVSRTGVADHVEVSFLRQGNATPLATKSYAVGALPATMSLGNLQANTTYEIKAEAFDADGVLLTTATSLCAVATNDRPASPSLVVDVPYRVTTLAGSTFNLSAPRGICTTSDGTVFVADSANHCIRKISGGEVTTFAGGGGTGSADGTGTNAQFNTPNDVKADSLDNLYVADLGNDALRKITPSGVVSTVATGGFPFAVAIDSSDNVYYSENMGNRIQKKLFYGPQMIFAGGATESANLDGNGICASFTNPQYLAFDTQGNLYVGQSDRIRKITMGGDVTTLPGSGGTTGLAVAEEGYLYITKQAGILKRHILSGSDTFVAGVPTANTRGTADGLGSVARFGGQIWGMAVDENGHLYVADAGNSRIRKVF